MYINLFIYFILYSFCFKKSFQSYIIYPFKKSTKQEKEYPEDILQNDLEITIEIGTPPQKIDLNLRCGEYTFFVASSELNLPFTTFNEEKSDSFKRLLNFSSKFRDKEYTEGYKISESITIDNKENKNITLIYATSLSYIESGALGLKLLNTFQYGFDLSFIYQIKEQMKLDNYSFFIKYDEDSDEKGQILIGSFPHIYDSRNYNEENFYFQKAGKIKDMIDWALDFDIIKYNNSEIDGIAENCLIRIEYGLIQAPYKLKQYFQDNYFNRKCNETYYNKRSLYIINCDKDFNIFEFKNLSFVLKDIEYEFVLTYKDLFIERENDYIFGIVFDSNINDNTSPWIFGKIFMKKYQLYFDLDRKIIGLYKNNKNNNKNKNKENGKGFSLVYIILIIILTLVSIGLATVIVYLVKKQRKNKANELVDDNFDYIPSE